MNLFSIFLERPTDITFDGQEEDEIIELFLRRHWVTNIGWVFISLLIFVLPAFLISLDQFLGFNYFYATPNHFVIGGIVLYYMLLSIYVIENFLFWVFNVDIVTDQHLVDIEFNSLLSKDLTEVGLEDIEAVSAKKAGLLSSLFDYGDVEVQTAAEKDNIVFGKVLRPSYVVDKIQDLRTLRKLYFEGDKPS